MSEKRQLEEAVEPEPKRVQLMLKALYDTVMDILSEIRPIAKVDKVAVSSTKFIITYKVKTLYKIQGEILAMLLNWTLPSALVTLTQVDWDILSALVLPNEGASERLRKHLDDLQMWAGKYQTKILSDSYWPRQAADRKNELDGTFRFSNNAPMNQEAEEMDALEAYDLENPNSNFTNMLLQYIDGHGAEVSHGFSRGTVDTFVLQAEALGDIKYGRETECYINVLSDKLVWENPADKRDFAFCYFPERHFGTLMFDNGQLFVFQTKEDMKDCQIPTPTSIWTWYGVQANFAVDFTRFRLPPTAKSTPVWLALNPLWIHLFKL
jgi:hypothetical protein